MFSAFEWMMAMRYLRARRREGFISVIAWFSLAGIALGVATLIIVMAVMNGFRQELLSRILGTQRTLERLFRSRPDHRRFRQGGRKDPGALTGWRRSSPLSRDK